DALPIWDHTLQVSHSGLVTITGGKWTTYRKMAEDTVDHAAPVAGLEPMPCPTRELPIHGYHQDAGRFGRLAVYGSDAPELEVLARDRPELGEPLHPDLPVLRVEVLWAVRREMARRVEDVLSRRTRALILDARAAGEVAAEVAGLMAAELGRDDAWARREAEAFRALAKAYLVQG
ncbi:MAG TPA: glycerol-3-phosphate dehydrogenase C-terminal domain-containing protein, partial [Longimicrobiales bacterium]|nr:glycerol-3-phosphate dehydrogenase C-terminal domain-containing protein [Longimicrobiales bacterium]